LGIREAPGFASELFEENAIFLLEEFDDRLLVSVHPAGDGNKEELELSCHGVKNLSKVAAAQSSKGPRLNFLVVQGLRSHCSPFFSYEGKKQPSGFDTVLYCSSASGRADLKPQPPYSSPWPHPSCACTWRTGQSAAGASDEDDATIRRLRLTFAFAHAGKSCREPAARLAHRSPMRSIALASSGGSSGQVLSNPIAIQRSRRLMETLQ
jgi:hypothetical protein